MKRAKKSKKTDKEVSVIIEFVSETSWAGNMRHSDFIEGLKIRVNSAYIMNCIRWGRDNCQHIWNIYAIDEDNYKNLIVYMIFSDVTEAVIFRMTYPEWCI